MNKVVIFVDVQNVYYTARKIFGKNFDYNKFWAKATGGRDLIAAKVRDEKGKRVEVYGVAQLTANSLINAASQFTPIDEQLLLR